MKTITLDEIMALEPCEEYTRKKVSELMAGREAVSVIDILDTDIPYKDKMWLVLRPELMSERKLHEVAIFCAEFVLPIYEKEYPNDDCPRKAIEAKRRWLNGEITDNDLAAARDAAGDASRAAVWSEEDAAARAAWVAAEAAAEYAARVAVNAASQAAELDAAEAAIIEHIRGII